MTSHANLLFPSTTSSYPGRMLTGLIMFPIGLIPTITLYITTENHGIDITESRRSTIGGAIWVGIMIAVVAGLIVMGLRSFWRSRSRSTQRRPTQPLVQYRAAPTVPRRHQAPGPSAVQAAGPSAGQAGPPVHQRHQAHRPVLAPAAGQAPGPAAGQAPVPAPGAPTPADQINQMIQQHQGVLNGRPVPSQPLAEVQARRWKKVVKMRLD